MMICDGVHGSRTVQNMTNILRTLAVRMGGNYRKCLEFPLLIIGALLALCALAAYQARNLQFDASSDTLIARGDPELAYYNRMTKTFGQRPFLVLTYTPRTGDLLSDEHVEHLELLTHDLEAIDGVEGVFSLLDAPLLKSPPIPLAELAEGFRTLQSANIDFAMAHKELTNSPLFRELLISADGQTTAIRIDLEPDPPPSERGRIVTEGESSADVGDALARADIEYRRLATAAKLRQQQTINAVRSVRDRYSDVATMYLGGVPMVASDMVALVKSDMAIFGLVILFLLMMSLYFFFRRLRWVLIPLGTTSVTILLTSGVLSALGWPITAVSSNFVSLLAIITISFTIHLIGRYRELYAEPSHRSHGDLAYDTMRSKLAPCLYTAATTIVAFASLVTSDIVPVMDFGRMMCVGIVISLVVTYSFFASILVLLPVNEPSESLSGTPAVTRWFAYASTHYPMRVLGVTALVVVAAFFGVGQLEVGNRIVEYFRSDTEIRQGLDFIDTTLGGTIPMDIVLTFDPYEAPDPSDDEDDFAEAEPDPYPERFWFTPDKLAYVDRLQEFLGTKAVVGKSVSVANLERVARTFNDGEPLSYLALTAILGSVPETIRSTLIEPYASPATGELRISTRLHETGPHYDLNTLIQSIEDYATGDLGLDADAVHVTGVAVLFNNMLEVLLQSQISTILYVILATFTMFAVLLRSVSLAVIGVMPNLLAAAVILAFMGYAGIPLDLMTITIAAIVIGIGVDDAIHYMHRFKDELAEGKSTIDAVHATHASIGKALYFTSLTVVIGFSVLMFSRFVPTVYFGWLAALAMVLALISNLTVLPALLVKTYRS